MNPSANFWRVEFALIATTLIVGTITLLARRFGVQVCKRAFGAILLGIAISIAGSILYMGFLFTDAIWRGTPRWILAGLPLGPLALGVAVMFRYNAPRFIRFSFIVGMAILPLNQSAAILNTP